MTQSPRIVDYLDEFTQALRAELEEGERKHGEEWLNKPRDGQEYRIMDRIGDYYLYYVRDGLPIPWLSVAGNAMIAWIRETHPELFKE